MESHIRTLRYSDFSEEDLWFDENLQAIGKSNIVFTPLWGGLIEPRDFDVEVIETTPRSLTLKFILREGV